MPSNLYPPLLASSQPAFLYNSATYAIYFTLQSMMTLSQIGHIQIRVVQQSNNRTIVNIGRYPDGIIYKNVSSIIQESGNEYRVTIDRGDLSSGWVEGVLYKIQIRFGSTDIWTNINNFANWKQEQINNQTFSEWSTVMVIKAISEPTITLLSATTIAGKEKNLAPLFIGRFQISEESKESEDKYKFDLYYGGEVNADYLMETTDWLQHNEAVNSLDTYRFDSHLVNGTTYTISYSVETVNGYIAISKPYTITVNITYVSGLADAVLEVDDSSPYARENACIRLYLTNPTPLTQTLVVTRSDESTDFQSWEDLIFIDPAAISTDNFDQTLIHTDFTIESGVGYKYAVQLQDSSGNRTNPKQEEGNPIKSVSFDYSYLYCDGLQLKLMLNQTMNSFKHTVLSSVQNTLGSQYPYILKNGYAYYAEFPINGLISIQMDEDGTFFQLTSVGYKYKDKVVIPQRFIPNLQRRRVNNSSQQIPGNYEPRSINLTEDNFYVERKFREKVEEFLNNYKYKLYKSPSEGNFIVVLTNISLSPNATLGRMIFSFSGTAYEVDEVTLDKLNEYGIITIEKPPAAARIYVPTDQDLSGKADKVIDAVSGNLAGLNREGNLTDSGLAAEDVLLEQLIKDFDRAEIAALLNSAIAKVNAPPQVQLNRPAAGGVQSDE